MVIGITGGIASGKSTVLRAFETFGAATVSADEISRRLMAPGAPLAQKVIEGLGVGYAVRGTTDVVDRNKLGAAVFHDVALRRKLEAIVHPAIIETLLSEIEELRAEAKSLIFAEVPLLYEAGLAKLFDRVLVVWCSKETQRARLGGRMPGLDMVAIDERIDSQQPLDGKRKSADIVVNSDQSLHTMMLDIRDIYDQLSKASK